MGGLDEHLLVQELQPFESLLGNASTRYFGTGFLRVRHTVRLSEVRQVGPESWRLKGTGAVRYPEDWSLDTQLAARLPHLSSVDVIVLFVSLLEAVPHTSSIATVGTASIERVALRASARPMIALDAVPLSIDLENRGGRVLSARAEVGGFRIEAVLSPGERQEHPATTKAYEDGYLGTAVASWVKTADLAKRTVHTMHAVELPDSPVGGMDSSLWPCLTHVHNIVLFGQIAQVLTHLIAGVARGTIDNLWMRRMSFERTHSPTQSRFTAESIIESHRIIDRGGRRLHSLEMVSTSGHGVNARASFGFVEPS